MNKITSFHGEYFFLSNFYPCSVEFSGEMYPSAEHAYVAAKTTDLETRKVIQLLPTASRAKFFGRSLLLREHWDICKFPFMFRIVLNKFQYNEYLRQRLLATYPAELEEGNYWGDTYWGVCIGVGENNLGKILMAVRALLAPDGDFQ